jgi:hypothetical protein
MLIDVEHTERGKLPLAGINPRALGYSTGMNRFLSTATGARL